MYSRTPASCGDEPPKPFSADPAGGSRLASGLSGLARLAREVLAVLTAPAGLQRLPSRLQKRSASTPTRAGKVIEQRRLVPQERLDASPKAMHVRAPRDRLASIRYDEGANGRDFLTKTLPKVATEMALSLLAYNLTRVMNIGTSSASNRSSQRSGHSRLRSVTHWPTALPRTPQWLSDANGVCSRRKSPIPMTKTACGTVFTRPRPKTDFTKRQNRAG